jgi:hypothetical protein
LTKKNEELVKRFTHFLENLPSETLRELLKTEALLKDWEKCRAYNYLVAKTWEAKACGFNDPLESMVDQGEIDPFTKRLIWAIVDHYSRLWELVQVVEGYVSYACHRYQIDYPFTSAADFFMEIVKELEDSSFKPRLKPYAEISIKKLEKASKAMSNLPNGKTKILSDIKGWLAQLEVSSDSPWLSFTLLVSEFLAKHNDRLVQARLEDLDRAVKRLSETNATGLRKRGSETWKQLKSHAWINGEIVPVQGQGNIYCS